MENLYLKGILIAYKGISMTLTVTLSAVIIGVILGFVVALGKMSRFRIIRVFFTVYVEILRGTPLIVQLLIMCYGVPGLLRESGFDIIVPALPAAIVTCGINSSAYVAEIIRSGLKAVDIGQTEAARSLGMTNRQAMVSIIIPQAFRIILPPLGNEFIALLKETAIISTVGVTEVTRKGMLWTAVVFQPWPAYLGVAFVYLSMTIPLSRLVALLERRMAKGDRSS